MSTPISNSDDLSKQRSIPYGTLNSGSSKEFFRSSRLATYERMCVDPNSYSYLVASLTCRTECESEVLYS